MLQLKDNVTLHVEAGATLFLIQDTAAFPRARCAMLFAENAVNVAITGRGRLDSLAQYEFVPMRGVNPEIAREIEIARAAGVDMRRYYRVGVQTYMCILNNISDSIIETADDAIVLKAIGRDGQPARPVENVTATNCILTSSSTALMIGKLCKLVLKKRTPASPLGAIRDIIVDNVIARGRGTSTIDGHPDRPIENLRLSNINLTMLPENAPDKRADDALFIESAKGLRIRDLSLRWGEEETEPKWRSALVLRRVYDFVVDGFKGGQGLPISTAAPLLVEDVDRGVIRNSEATEGSRRLVHVAGAAVRDVTVSGSRVPSGTGVATFERPELRRGVRVL